ncbi:MAG: hypothetical protein ABL882_05810 [Sphingopyxis sp.]
MLNDSKNLSPQADESSKDHFVLDFLYHDSRRIGSFLAQFEQVGHLSQLTQTNAAQEGESETKTNSGSLNLAVGKGTMEIAKSANSSLNDASQRVYDPFWSNARAFLDHL